MGRTSCPRRTPGPADRDHERGDQHRPEVDAVLGLSQARGVLPAGVEQLAADHVIGSAATEHISVMGYQERSLQGWRDKTSGEVIAHLRSQGVDGLILAPA